MHELGLKIRYSDPFGHKIDSSSPKKQSRFNFLYNQAFEQVKRKISTQEQNLPLLKLKSYQNPNYNSQKAKLSSQVSQRQQRLTSNPLFRHKSINSISVRYSAPTKKHLVNKILWQKKISLETLRISSTKRPSKVTLSKELQKESLKHLRQKTSVESKDLGYDEQNIYSHMSITPLNILSSKEQRQKFLTNKKNIEDKFKITFCNERDKNIERKGLLDSSTNGSFKNKIWQLDRDEDEFVNFVKSKTYAPDLN